jgi:hypothetical protein
MDPFMFLQFSFKMRYPVWGLRRGSGSRSGSARPPSHRYRSKAVPHSNGLRTQHLHPGLHSVPYCTHPHFNFASAHQSKAVGCPDPSPVLGSGPSRTGPNHPGIAFEWRAMPTMEGTVQDDDYRTEVRFKDKNLLKNLSFFLLRFT